MVKKIRTIIKLILDAGKATPAPPVGSSLGQYGINLMQFCKEYNKETVSKIGLSIPVKIFIYDDKTFSFILKSSPTSQLILKHVEISKNLNKTNIKIIKLENIVEIAKLKLIDLNTKNLNKAISIILGTVKNMGITVI